MATLDLILGSRQCSSPVVAKYCAGRGRSWRVAQGRLVKVPRVGSNSHGIGCIVEVHLEDGTILNSMLTLEMVLLGSMTSVHFGLGEQSIVEVKVKWSTGYIQSVGHVQVDSEITVIEVLPPEPIDFSMLILIPDDAYSCSTDLEVAPTKPMISNPSTANPINSKYDGSDIGIIFDFNLW